MSPLANDKTQARISLRIDLPGGARLGPGKAALMEAIAREGSLAGAARALSLSYPKAKRLVDELNDAFAAPLVATRHGGHERGGAQLTPTGQAVLALYQSITDSAQAGAADDLDALCQLARPAGES